jgi:hypothetical protein
MTREDIIRMARESDIDPYDMCEDHKIAENNLERFAVLVAAHEREECAKLADKYMERWTSDAIRARGKK